MIRISGIIFAIASVAVAAFQVALALGVPWGAYAMGGVYPGQFPNPLRFGAITQALILLFLAAAVLARAGVAFPKLARPSSWLVWIAVAFTAVSFLLNLITPSQGERLLWAPVAFVMLASSLVVAIGMRKTDMSK